MIDLSPIAERRDDAPRGPHRSEDKQSGFASILDHEVRAARHEAQAASDRAGPAPANDRRDRHDAAARRSDERSADRSERDAAAARRDETASSERSARADKATDKAPDKATDKTTDKATDKTTDKATDNDASAKTGTDTPTAGAPAKDDAAPRTDKDTAEADQAAPDAAELVIAAVLPSPGDQPAQTAQGAEGVQAAVAPPAGGTGPAKGDPEKPKTLAAPAKGAPATDITLTAGVGEASAPAAETAPPTAAQVPVPDTKPARDAKADDSPAPAEPATQAAQATPAIPAVPAAPATPAAAAVPDAPGKAAPTEHSPDLAALGDVPPRTAAAEAALAGKPATKPDHAATPAQGKPAPSGDAPPAPAAPNAAAHPAKPDAPAPTGFAELLGGHTDDASASAKPATAPVDPTAGKGDASATGRAHPATDAAAVHAQTQSHPQTAGGAAPTADLPPSPTTEARPAAGAPQVQAATPASPFASNIQTAADLSPRTETAAGRTALPAAIQQVSFQIARSVQNGLDRFTMELKPADLGHVSVKLEIGFDHRVIAVISTDRADTLHLLRRDAHTLERALQDSGLKTDSGSLSFNLRGDGGGYGPAPDAPLGGLATMTLGEDIAGVLDDAPVATLAPAPADGSGINIQV